MARTQTQKAEHIAAVPIFQRLTQRQLRRVAKNADEITVEKGRMLTREGEFGRELLIVVDGKASVKRKGRRIAELSKGDFFGEMSLIDGQPRSATVTAETDMTLLVIEGRAFKPLLDDVPGIKDNLIKGLVERLRRVDDQLIE